MHANLNNLAFFIDHHTDRKKD